MAGLFAFIAITFLKLKLSKIKLLDQEMTLRQKLMLVLTLAIFLLNLNSCLCRIFFTYYSAENIQSSDTLFITSLVMVHVVLPITDAATALTFLYLVKRIAQNDL